MAVTESVERVKLIYRNMTPHYEYNLLVAALGGCPRIEAVARESGFESIFSIK